MIDFVRSTEGEYCALDGLNDIAVVKRPERERSCRQPELYMIATRDRGVK